MSIMAKPLLLHRQAQKLDKADPPKAYPLNEVDFFPKELNQKTRICQSNSKLQRETEEFHYHKKHVPWKFVLRNGILMNISLTPFLPSESLRANPPTVKSNSLWKLHQIVNAIIQPEAWRRPVGDSVKRNLKT